MNSSKIVSVLLEDDAKEFIMARGEPVWYEVHVAEHFDGSGFSVYVQYPANRTVGFYEDVSEELKNAVIDTAIVQNKIRESDRRAVDFVVPVKPEDVFPQP